MSIPSKVLLTITTIDTEEAFQGLADGWNDLAIRSTGSVFLRFEWFDAAWAWRKENSRLCVLLALAGNQLVGILPLVWVCTNDRFPKLRGLEFLTVPDTQTCDLIVEPEHRCAVVDAFCEELHRRHKEWDQLTLPYLNEASVVLHEFKAGMGKRYTACSVKSQGPNLFVKLGSTWEAYYSTRSRSLKKANNLAANRLKKTGRIEIQWLSRETSNESSMQNALAQAIDISARSWKQSTGNSLDNPGPMRFIKTLTKHATQNGWLSLWLLTVDGRALAMEYQLLEAGNVYALRADFDAECEETSPGSHLMRTLLETLFDRGLHKYYMGPGENAYKTRWTEDNDTLFQLIIYGKTWRGQIARIMDEILKPVARSLRDKLVFRNRPTLNKG